jgi:hypothetical protein
VSNSVSQPFMPLIAPSAVTDGKLVFLSTDRMYLGRNGRFTAPYRGALWPSMLFYFARQNGEYDLSAASVLLCRDFAYSVCSGGFDQIDRPHQS